PGGGCKEFQGLSCPRWRSLAPRVAEKWPTAATLSPRHGHGSRFPLTLFRAFYTLLKPMAMDATEAPQRGRRRDTMAKYEVQKVQAFRTPEGRVVSRARSLTGQPFEPTE